MLGQEIPESSSSQSQFALFQPTRLGPKSFLTLVTRGEQTAVEKLLQSDSSLAVHRGDVVDPSGRKFIGITGLQIAAWALDWAMCNMFRKYMDESEIHAQLNEQEALTTAQGHGAHFEITPLLQAYDTYLSNYYNWYETGNWLEMNNAFRKGIGGGLHNLPAIFAQYYCNPAGFDLNTYLTEELTRQLDTDVSTWWDTAFDKCGGLRGRGSRFSWLEGASGSAVLGPTQYFPGCNLYLTDTTHNDWRHFEHSCYVLVGQRTLVYIHGYDLYLLPVMPPREELKRFHDSYIFDFSTLRLLQIGHQGEVMPVLLINYAKFHDDLVDLKSELSQSQAINKLSLSHAHFKRLITDNGGHIPPSYTQTIPIRDVTKFQTNLERIVRSSPRFKDMKNPMTVMQMIQTLRNEEDKVTLLPNEVNELVTVNTGHVHVIPCFDAVESLWNDRAAVSRLYEFGIEQLAKLKQQYEPHLDVTAGMT